MTNRVIMLVVCLLPAWVTAAPSGWTPLLEPAQLLNILSTTEDVRVVHLTGDYSQGHIPGAVSAPYGQFRGPAENAGELPALPELTRIVQHLGISADTPVVLVHAGTAAMDMGASTRVYWTLKSLGVETLAVLNGGFAAWQSAGMPVSTEAANATPSNFEPVWSDAYRMSTSEIEALIAAGEGQIIDARPAAYFSGQQSAAARAGTLPGAINLSFEDWFDGNRMQATDTLRAMLSEAADTNADVTLTFCNTGHLGSINWFVISELGGVDNTRLYAESITEWAMDANRPMANEP